MKNDVWRVVSELHELLEDAVGNVSKVFVEEVGEGKTSVSFVFDGEDYISLTGLEEMIENVVKVDDWGVGVFVNSPTVWVVF